MSGRNLRRECCRCQSVCERFRDNSSRNRPPSVVRLRRAIGRGTGNSDVTRLGKVCRPSIKERRKAAVLSGIEMFRQLLGNECALLSFFQCECQQNSPDDAEQDNIRKIPMNAVLPCFHSLVITEAWAKLWHAAKVISERCNDGFLAASSRKGPSAINQLRNIGSHASFISRNHLECPRSVYSG